MKLNNIYLTLLENEVGGLRKKFLLNLISKRIQEPFKGDYVERHHIIPKSWGGPDIKENLVILSAREHFLIHYVLANSSINDIKKTNMIYALNRMMHSTPSIYKSRYIPNSIFYENARKLHSENMRKKMKGENNPMYQKFGKKNPMYGKKFPERGEKMKGENNPMYKFQFSEKTLKLKSEVMKGEKNHQFKKTSIEQNNLIKEKRNEGLSYEKISKYFFDVFDIKIGCKVIKRIVKDGNIKTIE
jgi:hypothetical protein